MRSVDVYPLTPEVSDQRQRGDVRTERRDQPLRPALVRRHRGPDRVRIPERDISHLAWPSCTATSRTVPTLRQVAERVDEELLEAPPIDLDPDVGV